MHTRASIGLKTSKNRDIIHTIFKLKEEALMFNPQRATVVAIQKSQPINSVRQMYITVKREADGKEISFWWVSAPMVITSSGSSGNKAPEHFGKFWHSDDLVGKQVNLHHSGDVSHTYITYPD